MMRASSMMTAISDQPMSNKADVPYAKVPGGVSFWLPRPA
jgi:hypothetical protein